ncbi:MAG: hypothetical protein LBF18_23625, partial [Pantoea sp.]|nr:hypothetical protein [Pantoea sp.]
MAHMTSALTSVRGVNKTDVTTLVSNFGVRRRSTSPFLDLFVLVVAALTAGDGMLTLLFNSPSYAPLLRAH